MRVSRWIAAAMLLAAVALYASPSRARAFPAPPARAAPSPASDGAYSYPADKLTGEIRDQRNLALDALAACQAGSAEAAQKIAELLRLNAELQQRIDRVQQAIGAAPAANDPAAR
ncbi:MAG: hypothetical protein JWL84_111 [Rhodospirillales bacterium]|jgi:hypothetical protein|nr:hypothetical protein [Rhodospirillales bacterium]